MSIALRSKVWVLAAAVMTTAAVADVEPFTSEALQRGVWYTMQGYPPSGGYSGFGMAMADLDADRDLDLVLLGRSNGLPGIFENDGTGHFTDRSIESGIAPLAAASSVIAFDFDGDGDLDLFLTQYFNGGGNRLYEQTSPWHFTDVTAGSGLGEMLPTKGVTCGDYDGDGRLDLYLCQYVVPGNIDVTRNRLYRNLGGGHFLRVQPGVGVESERPSLMAAFTDFDADSWTDLYLANDRGPFFGPNQLWRNDDGVLVDVSESSGADSSLFSMCVAAGDLNRDGFPDYYITNISDPVPPLYGANSLIVSQGDGTYVEAHEEWGVGHYITSWGGLFWDLDNDSDLDLYVNNQWQGNTLYVNPGSPPMTNGTAEFALAGTGGVSYVSVVGDVDGDGDLDMLQNNHSGNVRLYINNEGSLRSWLRLRVVGLGANHQAAGASAHLRVGNERQRAEVILGGNSYLGQNEPYLHFGLGAATSADEILVKWPNGGPVREFVDVPANQFWSIYPPARLGDVEGDGQVGADDWETFQGFGLGPVEPGREVFDFNGDWVLDHLDVEEFWSRCAMLRGDLNNDGLVNGVDLTGMLSEWGNKSGPADLDLDGLVGGSDLSIMLSSWNAK